MRAFDPFHGSCEAGHKQFRRFLEHGGDSFLLQVIQESMKRGDLPNPMHTSSEGPVGMWRLKEALAAVTTKWGSLGS